MFNDILELLQPWIIKQKNICKDHHINLEVLQNNSSGIQLAFDYPGDYFAHLLAFDDPYQFYRYLMFEIHHVPTKTIIYYWEDSNIPIENLEDYLDTCVSKFLNIVG